MKSIQLYGIGNAIIDLQYTVSNSELEELGLAKGSMQLMSINDQLQLIAKLGDRDVNQASGGSAANTIITFSKLGGSAAFCSLLGNDHFGYFYKDEMRDLQIKINDESHESLPSGTCAILITEDAERTMNTYLGANEDFDPSHLDEEIIKESEWLYIEGYKFSSKKGSESIFRAIEVAKDSGTKIAITCSDKFIIDFFGEDLKKALESADLIFVNLTEALALTGTNPTEHLSFYNDRENIQLNTEQEKELENFFTLLHKKCHEFSPAVALTLGEKGSIVSYGGESARIMPTEILAIDDTGAGDAFAGGFMWGVCSGLDAKKSGEIASLLSSHVVSKIGPRIEIDPTDLLKSNNLI